MHLFFLREAWRSLNTHRGLALTAIFSLVAALMLSGLFLLLHHNAQRALAAIGDRREMVVYLKDDLGEPQLQTMIASIRNLYGEVTYVSRAKAWEEFADQIGDADLLRAVDTNPLPASLRIRLKPELLNLPAMKRTAEQVSAMDQVEDVRYGAEWVRRLDALSAGLRSGTLAIGVVVALAIVFILFTTLRLTVVARRPQVEIMSRLGATDRFIATPFMFEAVFETIVSALVALALVWGLQQGFNARIAGVAFLPWEWSAAFVAASGILAWIASSVALSRILRTSGA